MEQNNQIRFDTVEQDGFLMNVPQPMRVHLSSTSYYDIEVAEVLSNSCNEFNLVLWEDDYQGAIDEYIRLCLDMPVPNIKVQVVYYDSKNNRFFTLAMLLDVKLVEDRSTGDIDSYAGNMVLQFNQFVAGLKK
jgi:hypothetical protein